MLVPHDILTTHMICPTCNKSVLPLAFDEKHQDCYTCKCPICGDFIGAAYKHEATTVRKIIELPEVLTDYEQR